MKWNEILPIVLLATVLVAIVIGAWCGKATEVTATVTTFYVVVVYFQLQVMRRQYQGWQKEREAEQSRQRVLQPNLKLEQFVVRRVEDRVQETGQLLGEAVYVNCTVINRGGSLALNCQPVLSNYGRATPDGRWFEHRDWIPVGLIWSLDEHQIVMARQPTQERALVSRRPYLFDVGKVALYVPEPSFELRTILYPHRQPSSFKDGKHCFEVTVYSANADPVTKWYVVDLKADLHSEEPLLVSQLDSAPWPPRG